MRQWIAMMATAAALSGCVVVSSPKREAAAESAARPAPAQASRVHMAPPGWEGSYHRFHYTPVVRVGDQVIVSGIPAVEGADYPAKVRWMFEQLKAHLATAGAGLEDVVELTSFHRQPKDTAEFRAEFAEFVRIHADYFPSHYPAWTAVGTSALLADGAPVELRAVAIIGSGKTPRLEIAAPAANN